MALDIRYARNGGVAIAYQVVGEGETDLAYVPDFVSNLDIVGSAERAAELGDRASRELLERHHAVVP